EEARCHYDSVIVDVPPAIPFPDCRVISRWIDGFLLVVAAHRTLRKAFTEAVSRLDQGRVAAVVFNADDGVRASTYYENAHASGREAHGWTRAVRRLASVVLP